MFEEVISDLEDEGASADLTLYQLSLGEQDPVSGWFKENYTAKTVKGVIRPRGASFFHAGFAFNPKYALTAYLPADSGVRAGDRVGDAFGHVYKVESAEFESWLSKGSHYACNLTELPVDVADRLSGLWHLDSDYLVTEPRSRMRGWLNSYLASVAKTQPPACVLALPLNENVGVTSYDRSGNSYNATLVNGVAWDDGKYSYGLDFDGGNDYVTVGQHPTLNNVTLKAPSIVDSAVWCWFGDPRAVYYNGNTYIAYLTAERDIMVSQYNHASKTITHATIADDFSADDHANPSVIVRSDGKILVMWSEHSGNAMYYAVSSAVEDISSFEDTENFGYNIANPHIMRKGSGYFMIMRGTDLRVWVRMTLGGVVYNVYSTDPLPLGEDVHVAATYDGADIRIYVNGALNCVPEAVVAVPTAVVDALVIGAWSADGYDGNNWDGFLDELLIYDRAKGAAEIEDDYDGEDLVMDDCVLYLPCDEEGGATLFDYSGEGNNATAYVTEVVEGHVGNARGFNGFNSYASVPHHASLNLSAITLEAWVNADFAAVAGSTTEAPYTYPHLVQLDNGETWVFYRGTSGIYYRVSEDDGDTWSEAQLLFSGVNYFKEVTDGEKIFIALNDGHPDTADAHLYYIEYDSTDSKWYLLDGTEVGDTGDMPFTVADCTLLVAHRSWIWDIALDSDGYPVIVYVKFDGVTDHAYHYLRWNGTAWLDKELVDGGSLGIGHFELNGSDDAQPSYSAGAALDHDDPSNVYVSTKTLTGKFEVYLFTTEDNGQNWDVTPLTSHCEDKAVNMRPIVVRDHSEELIALWLYGHYSYYTAHDMMLRSYPEIDIAKTHNAGYTPFSVAVWVYPHTDSTVGNRHFLRRGTAYALLMQYSTRYPWAFIETLDNRQSVMGEDAMSLNAWNHIAATYDGLHLRLYHNKTLVYWKCIAGTLTGWSGETLFVGSWYGANSDNTLDGVLDEVYICNTTLSEADGERLADGTRYVNNTVMFHDSKHFYEHLFLEKRLDSVVTVGNVDSTPLYTFNHYPYGFNENVEVTCYATDKNDVSAVTLTETLEQETRRIATAYPFGSIRRINVIRHDKPMFLGDTQVWSSTVQIQYKRANDDYVASYPRITWGPSAAPTGTYIFPNVTNLRYPSDEEIDVWLHPPGYTTGISQAMGDSPLNIEITCDLDFEHSDLTWKRPQTTTPKTDSVNHEIFWENKHQEGIDQEYHTLTLSANGPALKVRLVKKPDVNNSVLTLLFREYTTATAGGGTVQTRYALT